MSKLLQIIPRLAKASALLFGLFAMPSLAADLSGYRTFPFGTDLPSVAKSAGTTTSEAKTIHSRPALIQELEWRPQPLGSSRQSDSVQAVVFRFLNGELFAVTVNYDRYETEGLTADDIIDAISSVYGAPEKLRPSNKAAHTEYGDQDELIARWQDSQYMFELSRGSYGPAYRLVGVSKKMQAAVQVAIVEAKRLDDREAPQKEAARLAAEKETEQAKLDKSRLLNKPKFRP
jgi:hypothetical protein